MSGALGIWAAAFAAGAGLGALYLALLWAGAAALAGPRPGAVFLALAAARAALVLAALAGAIALGAGAGALFAALAGFLVVRLAVMRRVRAGEGREGEPEWK